MKTVLIINGQDFLPFLAEEGIAYSQESRVERSVVTLNGRLYKTEKKAFPMTINLLPMNDEALGIVLSALSVSPATVVYVDRQTRTQNSGAFYVGGIAFTESYIAGNGTEMTGISFTLTPRL